MPKCKSCKADFVRLRPLQRACSPMCALALVSAAKAKKDAAEHRKAKAKAKTRGQWVKEAQAAFNAWVRARDSHQPCISCHRPASDDCQWHAGHYLSTGARPNLRFEADNVHKQCAQCNTHLSGNLINYRLGLIERVGVGRVLELEQDHAPRKYTIQELEAIKTAHKSATRSIKNA
jgi:hypothetical protein